LEIINCRGVKNLIVSPEAIPTLNFRSRLNTQAVVLRHSQLQQYIRILAISEKKQKLAKKLSSAKILNNRNDRNLMGQKSSDNSA